MKHTKIILEGYLWEFIRNQLFYVLKSLFLQDVSHFPTFLPYIFPLLQWFLIPSTWLDFSLLFSSSLHRCKLAFLRSRHFLALDKKHREFDSFFITFLFAQCPLITNNIAILLDAKWLNIARTGNSELHRHSVIRRDRSLIFNHSALPQYRRKKLTLLLVANARLTERKESTDTSVVYLSWWWWSRIKKENFSEMNTR